jgi:hypothetical protein
MFLQSCVEAARHIANLALINTGITALVSIEVRCEELAVRSEMVNPARDGVDNLYLR